MSNYQKSVDGDGESARDRWINQPVDWGRVFRGEPWQGNAERPLHYPMRAVGRYETEPPEEVDQDTGEVTTRGYWELRTSKDGTRMWWPVEAHARAARSEYRTSAAKLAMDAELDRRAGRD